MTLAVVLVVMVVFPGTCHWFVVLRVLIGIGGSVGTALLNTLAATAAADYLAGHTPVTAEIGVQAALVSYATAYWWGAAFFAAGAVMSALLFRRTWTRALAVERSAAGRRDRRSTSHRTVNFATSTDDAAEERRFHHVRERATVAVGERRG